MNTRFLTLNVTFQASPVQLQEAIVAELQQLGDPLRWAIVSIDSDRQTVQVEAVITTPSQLLVPSTSVISV